MDKDTACNKGTISNNVFQVETDGTKLQYRGMMKKRAHPGAKGFFHIKAGQKEVVTVDIGANYAFPKSGRMAKVHFDHFNHFSVNEVQLTSNAIEITLNGGVATTSL